MSIHNDETKKQVLRSAGFKTEVDNINNNCCPLCGKKVNPSDLRDELSKREYSISGICQECQDSFFG